MRILALDVSLTSTGYAVGEGSDYKLGTIVPPKAAKSGMPRLAYIRDCVLDLARGATMVVLEGYNFHSKTSAVMLGEIGGIIRLALFEAGIFYVEVPPNTLKKYATGKGKGQKAGILVAAGNRLGYAGDNDDEADALWLYAMALDAHGRALVQLPAVNREALHVFAV